MAIWDDLFGGPAFDSNTTLSRDDVTAAEDFGGGGYKLGRYATANSDLDKKSSIRGDESLAERYAEQRGDYLYGGTKDYWKDALATARGNIDPYTHALAQQGSTLSGYGDYAMGQAAGAQNRNFIPAEANMYVGGNLSTDHIGQQGQYGSAAKLMQLADQGPGPSAAQAQLQMGLNQGMNQNLALARSGRGMGANSAALAAAGRTNAQMAGQANAASAALRAQEEAQWRQQQAQNIGAAGSIYGAGRGSDLGAAQYLSGSALSQAGLNDAYQQGMLGQSIAAQGGATQAYANAAGSQQNTESLANTITGNATSANQAYEQGLNQIYGINQGVAINNAQSAAQQQAALVGMAGTTLGGLAMLSDVRAKKGAKPLSSDEIILDPYEQTGEEMDAQSAYQIPSIDQQEIRDPYAIATQPGPVPVEQSKPTNPGWGQFVGGLGSLGAMALLSDENSKKTIEKLQTQLDATLSALGKKAEYPTVSQPGSQGSELGRALDAASKPPAYARAQYPTPVQPGSGASAAFPTQAAQAVAAAPGYSYQYKNPNAPGARPGTQFGPMAQDLAKTPAGRSTVVQMPNGKLGVDTGRLSLVNTAALSSQENRLQDLEAELDKLRSKRSGFDVNRSRPDVSALDEAYARSVAAP